MILVYKKILIFKDFIYLSEIKREKEHEWREQKRGIEGQAGSPLSFIPGPEIVT